MAGAIAGTAILNISTKRFAKQLKLVTLTVNNLCNMNCPHCYLQLNKSSFDWLDYSISSKLLDSTFEHLAIVGKEPLVNLSHVEKLLNFTKQLKKHSKTVSIITNGKNLALVGAKLLDNLDFIDISFDGGEKTYENFRSGNFKELTKQIRRIYSLGFRSINALHSVHSNNLNNIDDMLSIVEIIPFEKIMFTPYLITENFGTNSVSRITLKQLFEKLSSSKKFMETKQAIVNVDIYHLEQEGISAIELLKLAKKFGLESKLVLHDVDLLHFGVVRITFDGLVLSPRQSLNPKGYSDGSDLKNFDVVEDAWAQLLK